MTNEKITMDATTVPRNTPPTAPRNESSVGGEGGSPDIELEKRNAIDSWVSRIGAFGLLSGFGAVGSELLTNPTPFAILVFFAKIAVFAAAVEPMLRYQRLEGFGNDSFSTWSWKTARYIGWIAAFAATIGIGLASLGLDFDPMLTWIATPTGIVFFFVLIVVLVISMFVSGSNRKR